MTPYSQDLRQRILDTVQRGEGSSRQIARRFLVSVSFVTRLLKQYRSTGSLEPKPHGGGHPPALGPEDLKRLRELIRQQPDATLEECRQRLGASCSTMTISRALRQLGLPRKKKVPRAREQDRPDVQEQRREFCEELADTDPRKLVFVDECGANTAMTRTHGRAPVGQRVYANTPGRWESITLTCGLRLSGVTAALAFPGATNTAVSEHYGDPIATEQKTSMRGGKSSGPVQIPCPESPCTSPSPSASVDLAHLRPRPRPRVVHPRHTSPEPEAEGGRPPAPSLPRARWPA